jgi:pimeloyl-ACP methyl ester carboxylesterase
MYGTRVLHGDFSKRKFGYNRNHLARRADAPLRPAHRRYLRARSWGRRQRGSPGTDDPIVPVANGHILAKLIPNARLTTIDDGHLFLVTSPCASAKLVSEFLLQSGCGD